MIDYSNPGEVTAGYDLEKQDGTPTDYAILCNTIKSLKDYAIKGRKESGIEDIWDEDQDHYDGVDDSNRGKTGYKPNNLSGPVTFTTRSDNQGVPRSTVFIEITRPYVDAWAASVSDMLLPTDDRNWSLEPDPIPDMIEQIKQGNPEQQDMAKQVLDAAKKACDKAQLQIDDWLTGCSYLDECRSMLDDASRLGTGILKGPIAKKSRKKAVINLLEGKGVIIKQEIIPMSARVDLRDFFPDPNCGEDIQRGKFCFERDRLTGRGLADLKGVPGYLDDVIDMILEDGPESSKDDTDTTSKLKNTQHQSELYTIWYFNGFLSAKDLDTVGEAHGEGNQFPVVVTLVNNKIIKASLSPLNSGEFPYDIFTCQRVPGLWAGKGVARQMRTEQIGVNAAGRALMNNMGESSKPYRVFNRTALTQGEDRWTWYTNEGQDVPDIRTVMQFFVAPSQQAELTEIINFWMKRAEVATGMPEMMQGQLGSMKGEPLGTAEILNNNASTVRRRVVKNYDARITERHIDRYYEWLLTYGKDDSAKGAFTIKARGSSALIERDIQGRILMQLTAASLNPVYKLDPAKLMAKSLKAQRISIEDVQMDEQDQQSKMQPQEDPRITVEKMKEAHDEKIKAATFQNEEHMYQLESRDKELDRQNKIAVEMIHERMASAELGAVEREVLTRIKAQLAETSMKLGVQQRLSVAGMTQADDHVIAQHMMDKHTHDNPVLKPVIAPVAEPYGKAPPGQAFVK